MARTITTEGVTYKIRGPYTATELRQLYEGFCAKYHSTITLQHWLVERGRVHFRIK